MQKHKHANKIQNASSLLGPKQIAGVYSEMENKDHKQQGFVVFCGSHCLGNMENVEGTVGDKNSTISQLLPNFVEMKRNIWNILVPFTMTSHWKGLRSK